MLYPSIKTILWRNTSSVTTTRICMPYDSLSTARTFNSLHCSDNWVAKYEKVINSEEISWGHVNLSTGWRHCYVVELA